MPALMLQAASMLLLALALALALAFDVQAAPPVLAISSEPLKAACRVAAPVVEQSAAKAVAVGTVGAGAGENEADGPSLLRAAPFPASGSTADLFQASMNMADWSGHFARYALSPANAGSAAPTMRWDAGALLTGDAMRAPSPFPNNRKIFTSIVQPDGTLNMVPFEWGALSTEQRQLLNRAPAPSTAAGADALGEERLGFLRGERAQEGKLFRKRSSVLGDSVNSKPVFVGPGPGPGGAPLFVARDAGGTRQPITQQPALAYANGGGYLVLFGTGKLIEHADRTAASFAPQSYYAIRDKLRNPAELITSRQQLTARVLNGDVNAPLLSVDGDRMEFDSSGWYVDFLQAAITGERSIDSGVLTGGTLLFNTLLPAADPCDKARRRTYALNVLTGLAADRSVVMNLPSANAAERPVVGLLSDVYASAPLLVQTTSSATARDPTRRTRVDKEFSITDVTSGGSAKIGEVKVKSWAGRLSWREVGNWRALHEAAK